MYMYIYVNVHVTFKPSSAHTILNIACSQYTTVFSPDRVLIRNMRVDEVLSESADILDTSDL